MTNTPPSTRNAASSLIATRLKLFSHLTLEEEQALAELQQGRQHHYGAREDVIREGQPPDHVKLIVSGWACRYKILEDGRRQILAIFFPGDLCDLRVFILKRMDHSIGTITPATIIEVAKDTIIDLTEGGSRIARALWWSSLVAEAIEREWIVNLGQRSALERIGHLLCELFLRQQAIGLTEGAICDMPLTQTDLGEICGLSVVHINRSLQHLRARGLIELRQKRLAILDFGHLARESMFNSNYLHLDGGSMTDKVTEGTA